MLNRETFHTDPAEYRLASEGVQHQQHWRMKQELKSPAYTTCWDELLAVD